MRLENNEYQLDSFFFVAMKSVLIYQKVHAIFIRIIYIVLRH